jgi:hypothetical protein
MTELAISSVGAPHPYHADRVTGLMMSHLARQSSHLADTMRELARKAYDGSPRALRRLEQRLQTIGTVCNRRIVSTVLHPGKRGQYRLSMLWSSGWDPSREHEIEPDDPVPLRPWLALWHTRITSPRKGQRYIYWQRNPVCFVTAHVLSRAAQRLGMRC